MVVRHAEHLMQWRPDGLRGLDGITRFSSNPERQSGVMLSGYLRYSFKIDAIASLYSIELQILMRYTQSVSSVLFSKLDGIS